MSNETNGTALECLTRVYSYAQRCATILSKAHIPNISVFTQTQQNEYTPSTPSKETQSGFDFLLKEWFDFLKQDNDLSENPKGMLRETSTLCTKPSDQAYTHTTEKDSNGPREVDYLLGSPLLPDVLRASIAQCLTEILQSFLCPQGQNEGTADPGFEYWYQPALPDIVDPVEEVRKNRTTMSHVRSSKGRTDSAASSWKDTHMRLSSHHRGPPRHLVTLEINEQKGSYKNRSGTSYHRTHGAERYHAARGFLPSSYAEKSKAHCAVPCMRHNRKSASKSICPSTLEHPLSQITHEYPRSSNLVQSDPFTGTASKPDDNRLELSALETEVLSKPGSNCRLECDGSHELCKVQLNLQCGKEKIIIEKEQYPSCPSMVSHNYTMHRKRGTNRKTLRKPDQSRGDSRLYTIHEHDCSLTIQGIAPISGVPGGTGSQKNVERACSDSSRSSKDTLFPDLRTEEASPCATEIRPSRLTPYASADTNDGQACCHSSIEENEDSKASQEDPLQEEPVRACFRSHPQAHVLPYHSFLVFSAPNRCTSLRKKYSSLQPKSEHRTLLRRPLSQGEKLLRQPSAPNPALDIRRNATQTPTTSSNTNASTIPRDFISSSCHFTNVHQIEVAPIPSHRGAPDFPVRVGLSKVPSKRCQSGMLESQPSSSVDEWMTDTRSPPIGVRHFDHDSMMRPCSTDVEPIYFYRSTPTRKRQEYSLMHR